MVETCPAEEARALPDAIWLPLGSKPAAALRHLVAQRLIPARHVLAGIPHPSGANAERIQYFLGRKQQAALSSKTRADLIDAARNALLAQVGKLQRAADMADGWPGLPA